jgi:hypothetical protein
LEKARKENVVWFRENAEADWMQKEFPSISTAKKFNGPNSRTVTKAPANPIREVVAA